MIGRRGRPRKNPITMDDEVFESSGTDMEVTQTPQRKDICKFCSAETPQKREKEYDPKGVHKCARCRRELLPSFAAKLPGIKKDIRERQKAEFRERLGVRETQPVVTNERPSDTV